MTLTDITPAILDSVREIHRCSGLDYHFPREFNTPLFPIRRTVMNDEGKPVAAGALKVDVEAYLWIDSRWGTPEMRWEALQMLHADMAERAREIGFDQAYCVLPPEVAERFGRRLEALGWKMARAWPLYTFQLR